MPDSPSQQLLVWRAGGMRCAAAIERLREVLPGVAVAQLPGVPAPVRGLANVRGELVTVVDGRTLVGEAGTAEPEATVLVQVGRRTVGLAVDEVEDLVRVGDDAFLPLGPGGRDGWAARVDDGEPARVLDLDELLSPLFPE